MRVLTDSICVRVLCRENVLVAIGNRLAFLYLDANGDTQQTFAAVPRLLDKIHGIVACLVTDSTYQIVFHAGPEAYSTIVDCSTHSFSECTRIEVREDVQPLPVPHIRRRVSDWISSVSLLSPTQLCLLTSHGVAVLLHRSAENPTEWSMIDKCACDDGSTLYCSTLSGQQWERLVCFTGTALGLLLIWRVAGDNRGKVLERISAHNGVIFSIACDFASGLLTTTSDDRSVKFWKIRQCDAKDDTTVVELHEERYCFAHTARVFQCRIIKNAFRCLVATIGEDSHLCLWNREGDLLLKKQLDEGATLWGMDYDPETTTIFVTASNGNLHKYSIKSWMEDSQHGSDIQHMNDISPTLAVGEHLAKIRIKTIITSALKEDPDRLLVISAGGRAQICLTTVRMLTLGPKQEYEYMLLASDAERCRWKTNRQSSYDPETKFMCAARVCEDRIVFGCSDGFIRIYKISHTDGQWLVELETESFYGRCVLQTVPIDGCTMEGLFVTMATDGYLCFWDITTPNEPIYRHRHHSSGMNSVDVRIDGKGNILLATGGDDQSISVSQFEVTTLDGRREVKHVVGLCEKYLHTAQVTGIKLLSDDRLISAGVDQRIYISSFTGFSSLAVTGTTSTCVADVKGISFISERNELIVYGCGIEIVNLSNL
ncbi:hypothetical protein AND_006841 [Anopheles darlingi]|uniref:tRNA (34-2'-O)-methyltransferase regulator WDR6 n=1 Tax=Anopheles darlingi TaxID=43151 RepID=W5JF35_ANODA|nr:hypothetical protein AND_006841 [Anopheles darlingi]